MSQINKTTAAQLAQLIINLDRAIDANDLACEALTAHSIKHKYTRDQARAGIVQYVAKKEGLPINDAYQFVKQTGALKTKWEKARKRVTRILAPIYSEPKPRKVNKVDAVEKLIGEFRAMTKAQQRRFMESI
jgi:hypothetical protein